MGVYLVGTYKQGNQFKGFRMLQIDEKTGKSSVMDYKYEIIVNALRRYPTYVNNMRLVNGALTGYNGSLQRYGVVGSTQALVILWEVQNKNKELQGYMCSDAMGRVKYLSEAEALGFATNVGIANGKVVRDNRGAHISCIEGSYKVITNTTPSAPASTSAQTSDNTQTPIKVINNSDVKALISHLRINKRYLGSYAQKIVHTIQKSKGNCTEKQFNALAKIDAEWTELDRKEALDRASQQTQTQKPQAQTHETQAPTNDVQASENKGSNGVEKADIVYADYPDYFEYKEYNSKDTVYITGVKSKYKNILDSIKIPETASINERKVRVIGIQADTFSGTSIKNVFIGRNIIDIGQRVFSNCKRLKTADLSNSQVRHIAMNMFEHCTDLENVLLPKTIERIHEGAFSYCSSLREIELPESTYTIARIAFYEADNLRKVIGSPAIINESAFTYCKKLTEFDFSETLSIGTNAFRGTGFQSLIIPGNVTNIGRKAFADCYALKHVELLEGIETIGEYAFAKSLKPSGYPDTYNKLPLVKTETIKTCRSIEHIGADAFRNVELVYVYTGSVSESQCIGFGINYEKLDKTTNDNSTSVRIKSEVMDINPMKMLNTHLDKGVPNGSNPSYEMKTDNLVNIPLEDDTLMFLQVPITSEGPKEPHIKFKGFVNYLQDTSDLFKDPLQMTALRLKDTFSVQSFKLFEDGYNRIYKIVYTVLDNLEQGAFVVVLTGNNLRYVAELTIATDVTISDGTNTDDFLPISKFLHAGDKIGNVSTISGHDGFLEVEDEPRPVNVGLKFYETIQRNSIEIIPQRKDSIWFIPACNLALKLHDKREWEAYEYAPGGKRVSRDSQDCLNLLQILTYDELIKTTKTFKKHSVDSKKFFKDLASMTDKEVRHRIKFLSSVEEEKEAQLYKVSIEFVQNMLADGVSEPKFANEKYLTESLFYELATSYWMVPKDERWLSTIGTKSLNLSKVYNIGTTGPTVWEYKSNQVVKFSNPYMNGQKGAYIFKVTERGKEKNIKSVFASRYNLGDILIKLAKLTYMKSSTQIMTLLTDPYTIDVCEPDLFYNFYDVLYSKDGWKFKGYLSGYSSLTYMSADFHIAMYKPTGIFYLTMEAYVPSGKDNKRQHSVLPIIPIGNMDRALMIATTTNSKSKGSKLLEELMTLGIKVISQKLNKRINLENDTNTDNYFKVRELIIAGVQDINKYKSLVNDRIVYMLGTVHKGELKRERNQVEKLELEEADEANAANAANAVAQSINNIQLDTGDDDYDEDEYYEDEEDGEEFGLDDDMFSDEDLVELNNM